MQTVQSADGTTIAFDRLGQGPAVILVPGALEYRALDSATAQLAPLLAEHFTVFHYDRRGRGGSTDTPPYAVAREIDDIAAVLDEAGGAAFAFGISSGAALALEAAIQLGGQVKKLAMYEAPYNDEAAARRAWQEYQKQLAGVLAQGRPGEALALFMMLVGMPSEHLEQVRRHPLWPAWEAAAPTLAYDAGVLGDEAAAPTEKAVRVAVPALVMDGSASFPFMHTTALALARAMPQGQQRPLEGQHEDASGRIDLRGDAATLVIRGRSHTIRSSLHLPRQGGGYSLQRGSDRLETPSLTTLRRPMIRFDFSIRLDSIIRGESGERRYFQRRDQTRLRSARAGTGRGPRVRRIG